LNRAIGRDPTNDICLDSANSTSSRFQARVSAEEGGDILTDLNSSNGTCLNGERVLRPTPLKDRDHIEIGEADLTFHVSLHP
jgi:pSer/pThr/pTyr-binding forkhead associated (FHA) protein